MKKLVRIGLVLGLLATMSEAAVMHTPFGLMSDTCVSSSGVWFTMPGSFDYLGSSCHFYLSDGSHHVGIRR